MNTKINLKTKKIINDKIKYRLSAYLLERLIL
jgi:hypothetical protein